MLKKAYFDELVRLNRGFDLPDSEIIPGEYPVVASTNIKAYHNEYKVEPPVVVTGRSGSLGSVQYITEKCWPLNTSLYAKDYRGNNPHYVYYYLQTMHLEQYNAGAGVPTLNQNHLQRMKIRIHPKVEQNRIVEILSAYDNLIEVNNKRIKVLEQMAENLYKEWFVRFRFPGHKSAKFENGLPPKWKECRLGDIMLFTRGVGYSSSDIMNGDSVLLSMNNIRPYGGYIADYSRVYSGKYNNDQIVRENDLIMSITDMTQDRRIIGYVGIVSPTEKNCIICTHLMKVTSSIYHNYFLYGLFTFSGLSRFISEYATGANVLGLTANMLNKIKCRVPDKALADIYTKQVTPLFKDIHLLEIQNNNLIKQRDLLLPRLMSGKLEV